MLEKYMNQIIELILHTDDAIMQLVDEYGKITYIILFIIIFCESGIILFPFLPGDGLLFSAGVIASAHLLDIYVLINLFILAAVSGNITNYFIGSMIGNKLARYDNKYYQKFLYQASDFYKTRGDKAILICRFFPILRTYVPFIAGLTKMRINAYILFSFLGAFLWVLFFLLLGYFIGEIPFVKANYGLIFLGLIIITLIPMAYAFIKAFFKKIMSM
jgi:membrane-associated protein